MKITENWKTAEQDERKKNVNPLQCADGWPSKDEN